MKIFSQGQEWVFDFSRFYADTKDHHPDPGTPNGEKDPFVPGTIKSEGHQYRPSVEMKAWMEISFDDAQALRDALDKVLKSMPCPHCGRKES